ncbi:hypothetical protein CA850_26770 [Micromonospora echinospora]|uniref:DUF1877 family protein n=1 Tax=Micromonospora echinospora TaxID=1877 RepID=A0A1C4VTS5_MICEC|nr:hypothetical protein [Micromonospora echinospora]OZV76454.1 hypothetical protein CA850_26770 [Micromonospora echinospora]SCE87211.1 hypothetical protein GA0070618_1543 [Micromonospora echinospora]
MGVLYDYFRAPNTEAVAELMAAAGGGPLAGAGDSRLADAVDAVDAKGIDPSVILGQLVSYALDVPWDTRLVGDRLVWPDGAGRDPGYEGPWVVVLGDSARDALAGIPDERMSALADRWLRVEELSDFGDPQPAAMLVLLSDLVGLARRARGNGDHLYCWMCL